MHIYNLIYVFFYFPSFGTDFVRNVDILIIVNNVRNLLINS